MSQVPGGPHPGGSDGDWPQQDPAGGPKRTPKGSSNSPTVSGKRAVQACTQCRRSKLRCLGGHPCSRCAKNDYDCVFERAPPPVARQAATERLERLEESVGSLLASLGNIAGATGLGPSAAQSNVPYNTPIPPAPYFSPNPGPGPPGSTAPVFLHYQPAPHPAPTGGVQYRQPFPPLPTGPGAPSLPGVSLLLSGAGGPNQFSQMYTLPANATPLPSQGGPHLPPTMPWSATGAPSTPMELSDPPTQRPQSRNDAHSSSSPSGRASDSSLGHESTSGENRLRVITDPAAPPFKPVLYHPKVWNNQEMSRSGSVEPTHENGEDADGRDGNGGQGVADLGLLASAAARAGRAGLSSGDDPIIAGILTKDVSIRLFDFYAKHCHPFLPVLDLETESLHDSVRHSSPFLFATILAVAARFSQKSATLPAPGVDFSRLISLAYDYLSRTLLRKDHYLQDVQATLLLAGWGLQSKGGGPDAWMLTGHAWRMARRLGLDQINESEGAKLFSKGQIPYDTSPPSSNAVARDPREVRADLLSRWRTWLCLYCYDRCLTLGFGRPPTPVDPATVDPSVFLQGCLAESHSPSTAPGTKAGPGLISTLTGDLYIASQVELMEIARDLCDWVTEHKKQEKASWKHSSGTAKMSSAKDLLLELNERLDLWCRVWTRASSPHFILLGPLRRNARLFCEHVRLCLNTLALNHSTSASTSEESSSSDRNGDTKSTYDASVAEYVEKGLNAATEIIETYHDLITSDSGLSYAIDYLPIALSTAAVFLIRLQRTALQTTSAPSSTTSAPAPAAAPIHIERSVMVHFLVMATATLEQSDRSETRLGTYLARTVREISRAAGFEDIFPPSRPSSVSPEDADARASAANSNGNKEAFNSTESIASILALDPALFDMETLFPGGRVNGMSRVPGMPPS